MFDDKVDCKIKTVAIEGSDGAGKATQTDKLVKFLRRHGFKVGTLSFPRYTDTPAGRMLFEVMKSERAPHYDWAHVNPKLASLVYAEDRAQSKEYILNLIAENDVVIFDRYVESNLLHQGGKFTDEFERMVFANWLSALEYDHFGLPKPDVTIYLDLPPEVSRARALKRAQETGGSLDAVESDMQYVENGTAAGRSYAEMFGWAVVKCVIPSGDAVIAPIELSTEEIHMKIRDIVLQKNNL